MKGSFKLLVLIFSIFSSQAFAELSDQDRIEAAARVELPSSATWQEIANAQDNIALESMRRDTAELVGAAANASWDEIAEAQRRSASEGLGLPHPTVERREAATRIGLSEDVAWEQIDYATGLIKAWLVENGCTEGIPRYGYLSVKCNGQHRTTAQILKEIEKTDDTAANSVTVNDNLNRQVATDIVKKPSIAGVNKRNTRRLSRSADSN